MMNTYGFTQQQNSIVKDAKAEVISVSFFNNYQSSPTGRGAPQATIHRAKAYYGSNSSHLQK